MAIASPPDTDRSKLLLSEVARHVVAPEGIVDSLWYDVELRLAEFGVFYDTWQDGLAQLVLGLREDGLFACSIGGITLSIPRQVAKTFVVLTIAIALCTMYPDLTVLWTAHRVSTSTHAFEKARRIVEGKAVRAFLMPDRSKGIRLANGEQQIRFRNGSIMHFGSRQQGAALGFDEIDIEVFDEAQRLTASSLENMVPATNQSRFQHGALLFFMGTPPRPEDPGEEFAARRRDALERAIEGQPVTYAGDGLYVECSADPELGRPGGPSLEDREQLKKANPSYPHRTPEVAVLRMFKQLPSAASKRREAFGVWDDDGIRLWQIIGAKQWASLTVSSAEVPEKGQVAFGVKFSADGERVGVGAAIRPRDGGPVFVEALNEFAAADGTARLVEWLAERGENATIAVDGKAGAGDLVAQLIDANVPKRHVHEVTTPEAVRAHAGFLREIREGGLIHSGQKGLENQVKVAGRRTIGNLGGWGWQPVTPDGDVTALDAVTLAFGEASSARSGRYTGEAVIA